MATCSSILAWKTPWKEEPGGLQSIITKSWTWVNDWARMHTSTYLCLHICKMWVFNSTYPHSVLMKHGRDEERLTRDHNLNCHDQRSRLLWNQQNYLLSCFLFFIFLGKTNEVAAFDQALLSYHLLIHSPYLKMKKSPSSKIFSELPRNQWPPNSVCFFSILSHLYC